MEKIKCKFCPQDAHGIYVLDPFLYRKDQTTLDDYVVPVCSDHDDSNNEEWVGEGAEWKVLIVAGMSESLFWTKSLR